MSVQWCEEKSDREVLTSWARGGMVVLYLQQGSRLTTREIAQLTSITRRGAQYMMDALTLVFPIVFEQGKWRWMTER